MAKAVSGLQGRFLAIPVEHVLRLAADVVLEACLPFRRFTARLRMVPSLSDGLPR